MGDILTLAPQDYTNTDEKIDLINGVLRLSRGSWIPEIGEPGGPPVVETMDLVSNGDRAALLAELARVEGRFETARTYPINPVQTAGTWLEWGIDTEPRVSAETGFASKRAWVYGGKAEIANVKSLPGPFIKETLPVRLALRRHPLWENLEDVYDFVTTSAWGDVEDLTGLQAEMGTAPGRIEHLMLKGDYSYAQELWMGWRSEQAGFSQFDPLWELENGVSGADTTDTVDATASGGYKCACTFATEAGLDERVRIGLHVAFPSVTSWNQFCGRYLVLCRLKVGSSTECGIVLRSGGVSEPDLTRCEEVYVDNTSWKLIELGEVTIPTRGYRREYATTNLARYHTFAIEAERLNGSGSLDLDCLYLIPSEHFIHAWHTDNSYALILQAYTHPDDTTDFQMNTGISDFSNAQFAARGFHLPTDIGFCVMAGQTTTDHDMAETNEFTLNWYPRWSLYRSV